AGDITVGLEDEQERALALLQPQPFVRQAGPEGDGLRLYVDKGDSAMPAVLRLLDGVGFQLKTIALSRPQPGRRLPPADWQLAARHGNRGRGMTLVRDTWLVRGVAQRGHRALAGDAGQSLRAAVGSHD